MIDMAKEAIQETLGKVYRPINTPGGDDFHFYKKELNVKACFVALGADLGPGLHHPDMKFNHRALKHGVEILGRIVEKRLG